MLRRAGRTEILPISLLHEVFEHGVSEAAKSGQAGLTPSLARSFAFDGRRNAYSLQQLKQATLVIDVDLPERDNLPGIPGTFGASAGSGAPRRRSDRKFVIRINFAREVDTRKLKDYCRGDRQLALLSGANVMEQVFDSLQALDILLRNEPSKRYKVAGQRHKFFDANNTVPIGQGGEVWKGFFQSVRPTMSGLVVNVDAAFSAFLGGGDMMSFCAQILNMGGGGDDFGGRGGRGGRGGGRGGRGGRGGGGGGGHVTLTRLQPFQLQELRKRLKNVQIRVTHRATNKVQLFKGFTPRSVAQCEFQLKDGTRHTIVSYFRDKFGYNVRFPDLPGVFIGNTKTIVPMEVCMVVPGTRIPPTRLNPIQVQNMIRESAQRPDVRFKRVEEIRRDLAYERDPRIKDWGIQIAPRLMSVPGRLLPSPEVHYAKGGQRPRVQNGSWNLVNAKFTRAGQDLVTWAVVNFSGAPESTVRSFVTAQIKALVDLGIRVVNQRPPYFEPRQGEDVRDVLNNAGRAAYADAKALVGPGRSPPIPQLFLCLMDRTDQGFYDRIKRTAALHLSSPVPSQVVNTKKALNQRGQHQYVANVAMKINIKLGGTNQIVTGPRDLPGLGPQTMLVGADVSHPGPGMELPSIASSVATVDGERTRYSSEIRAQMHPGRGKAQEVIVHSKSMMEGHLRKWLKRNSGRLPDSVIVFRDGVSEGQYQAVLDHELKGIRQAIQSIKPGSSVKITYVACGKRHHVRFAAQNPNDTDGRSGNLPAGMVCDRGITSPYAFDFYLQSQAGLVGTTRLCHYVVVHDDKKFTSDSLQRTINSLCYSYTRATRAVSLVPPAYYADLLCEKARALVWGEVSDTSTIVSGEQVELREEQIQDLQVMAKLERGGLFTEVQWYM